MPLEERAKKNTEKEIQLSLWVLKKDCTFHVRVCLTLSRVRVCVRHVLSMPQKSTAERYLGFAPVLGIVVDAHDVDPHLVAGAQLEAAHHRVAAGLPLQPHHGGHGRVDPAPHPRRRT